MFFNHWDWNHSRVTNCISIGHTGLMTDFYSVQSRSEHKRLNTQSGTDDYISHLLWLSVLYALKFCRKLYQQAKFALQAMKADYWKDAEYNLVVRPMSQQPLLSENSYHLAPWLKLNLGEQLNWWRKRAIYRIPNESEIVSQLIVPAYNINGQQILVRRKRWASVGFRCQKKISQGLLTPKDDCTRKRQNRGLRAKGVGFCDSNLTHQNRDIVKHYNLCRPVASLPDSYLTMRHESSTKERHFMWNMY